MTDSSTDHPSRSTSWQGYLRPYAPQWLRDIYNQFVLSRSLGMRAGDRARFVLAAASNRGIGVPDLVRLRLGPSRLPIWVRPYTSDQNVAINLHLRDEYGCVKQFVSNPRTILDLGVNIGASLLLWSTWYPGSAVVGVEPDACNLAIAKLNVASLLGGRLTLHQAGIHDKPGDLYLSLHHDPWAISTSELPQEGSSRIRAVTVEDLLATLPEGRAGLLKCDVEGAERVIFASCDGWIDRVDWIVVETHRPYTLTALQSDLRHANSFRELVYSIKDEGNEVGLFAPYGWARP